MLGRYADLLAAVATAAAAACLVAMSPPVWASAVLGVPLALFLPGYALTRFVFGAAPPFAVERLLLSLALSIAADVAGGFALNWTPWGLRPVPYAAFLAGVTLLACVGAAARGPLEVRREGAWRGWTAIVSVRDAVLLVMAVVVTVGAIQVARAGASQQSRPGFTQFWMLPLSASHVRSVSIGIHSHEHSSGNYSLALRENKRSLRSWGHIKLQPGAQSVLAVALPQGTDGKIEADLYLDGRLRTPYRRVSLYCPAKLSQPCT